MLGMPKALPPEFRGDVVAVARKGEAPLSQIEKDFGICESCLRGWLKLADIDVNPAAGSTELDLIDRRDLMVGQRDRH
jgi:transposase-like protein